MWDLPTCPTEHLYLSGSFACQVSKSLTKTRNLTEVPLSVLNEFIEVDGLSPQATGSALRSSADGIRAPPPSVQLAEAKCNGR